MAQPVPEHADERLLHLVARALRPAGPSLCDVAAAGHSLWTWHGVSGEITDLLVESSAGPKSP